MATLGGSEDRNPTSWSTRFPNAGYQIIAVVCLFFVVVEATGQIKGEGVTMAILLGVAILALLAPKIQNLTVGKDGIVADLAERIDDSKKATVELDEQLSQQIAALFDRVDALLKDTPKSDAAKAFEARNGSDGLPAVSDEEDPQKGRFGGDEEHNGRRLVATVEPSSVKSEWCKLTLRVVSTDATRPLVGKVKFFLHDTFQPDIYDIPIANNQAELVLRAWGAFTIGAIADNGATKLELDLATSPNVQAPTAWRMR